jgi:hypothetical protein
MMATMRGRNMLWNQCNKEWTQTQIRCVRWFCLTLWLLQVASISQLTVSRLSRQCGILNITQPYRPPRSCYRDSFTLFSLNKHLMSYTRRRWKVGLRVTCLAWKHFLYKWISGHNKVPRAGCNGTQRQVWKCDASELLRISYSNEKPCKHQP